MQVPTRGINEGALRGKSLGEANNETKMTVFDGSLFRICDKLGVSNHVELVRSCLRQEESANDEGSVSSPSLTGLAVPSNVSVLMRNPG
jgi:hypothetical protein